MFTFTDMAVDYSVDELDDLTDRKVAPEGIDGNRLARIVRARRGAARATGRPTGYDADAATRNLWGSDMPGTGRLGDRRMAAVGLIDPAWGDLGWGEEYVNADGDIFRWYPLDGGGPTIVRGPNY